MGEITAISWCDHTFNPWIGCTKVSPACDGCYAEALMDKRYGRVEWGAPGKGVGTRVRTSAGNWHQPIRWNKKAQQAGIRPFVFCSSLADVFDNQVPTAWRTDLFELIRATPNLVWLLLTKRPQNIVRMYGAAFDLPWPRNAAIGTTCEDQERANKNVPALLEAKGELNPAFAFLSCEPLLGPINLRPLRVRNTKYGIDEAASVYALDGSYQIPGAHWTEPHPRIDWVITGGETDQGGHKARPTHPDWYRSLRDQCAAAGVAYHHKQNGEWSSDEGPLADGADPIMDGRAACAVWRGDRWERFENGFKPDTGTGVGEWVYRLGKARSGRLLDGVEHNARPEVRP